MRQAKQSGFTLWELLVTLLVAGVLLSIGVPNFREFQRNGASGRISGPAPNHATYGSFATFSDPDGNSWLLQEVTSRLPGRGVSSFDVATLRDLLRETEEHHGQYEPTAPKHHWSEWYARYMVARAQGKTSEEAFKSAKL